MGDMGNFGWGPGFGWLLMLLFWTFVILGIVAGVKWLSGANDGSGRQTDTKTPLQILQERYARGEIGQEEFEQKKRRLTG